MILHIANDYSGSTVYMNLVRELDNLGVEQVIYTPIKSEASFNKNKISLKVSASCIIYSFILNMHLDRILYRHKIQKILKNLESKVDLSKIRFIHAHTWYSDGGVAYELYKKFSIPYIVTIRNTDLNLFFKYMLHLRKYGHSILKHASKIIFISPIYKQRFLGHPYLLKKRNIFSQKIEVIPNGINDFWFKNVSRRKKIKKVPLDLLFIGKFTRGKNVLRLLQAVEQVRTNVNKVNITLVGGEGGDQKRILKYIEDKEYVTFLGKITDEEKLIDIFRNSDVFVMPSKSETFGLVYLEAFSQGIPVIYTKNEGIDGFFGNETGEAVDNTSAEEIANKIEKVISNYDRYEFDPKLIIKDFDWNKIAQKYKNIYLNYEAYYRQ